MALNVLGRFVLIAGVAGLLGGCQAPVGGQVARYWGPGPSATPGYAATCRSALTGEVYTARNAGCSGGDQILTSAADPAYSSVPIPVAARAPAKAIDAPVRNVCVDHIESGSRKAVSIPELIRAMSTMNLKKDEFETTDTYRARLGQQMEKVNALLRSKIGEERIVVSVPVVQHAMKYDADRGALTIGSFFSPVETGEAGGFPESVYRTVIVTDTLDRQVGGYVGENAYGAKRAVSKTTVRQAGIAVSENSSSIDVRYWPRKDYSLTLNMSADEARSAKANMRVLAVGRLREPYVVQGTYRHSPTIDMPMDTEVKSTAVNTALDCAIMYNPATKKVYATLW
ncbi:hypothetical protein [Azospirillum sp.]|uniref:hypothetical protein n=1 Tax=Azospirillum sp. TaxID=34012 RepID=UPI003D71BD49